MNKFLVAVTLIAATLGASPAPDRLSSLGDLVGSWQCTYRAGATSMTYKAAYIYDASGNWLVERDTSPAGSDEGRFTYDTKRQRWIIVVTGSDRSVTVFEGTGDVRHVAYHTVYPNEYATETIDRISPKEYTVHFTGTMNGQTTTSMDVCVKR